MALDPLMEGALLAGKAVVLLPAMVAVVVVVGLLATLGPARRALRIQPTGALREE
jgi:ABC-type antimicrobial peptide transport system permease subunit